MSGDATALTERVRGLRDAFDRSFAEPLRSAPARFEHLLAIRVAGEPYAVRLEEIAGLHAGWPVTAVPSPSPALLGIAGFRGSLVPVYDLSVLLGLTAPPTPRWIALSTGRTRVAFAFAGLDGHLQVAPDTLATEPGAATGGRRGRAVLGWAGSVWTVLCLPELVAAIRSRRPDAGPPMGADDNEE